MRVFAAFVAVLIALPSTGLAAPRPVKPEDLYRLKFVAEVAIAPSGGNVAFVVQTLNGPEDRYDSNIWLVGADGHGQRQITHGNFDSSIAWSPDGNTVAFARGGVKKRPQLYLYDLRTGHTRQLTTVKSGAGNPLFSHDGKRILFSSTTVDDQPNAQIDFAAAGFKPKKTQQKSDVHFIDTMHYTLNGPGEIYNKHAHIWVVDADGKNAHALTSGHEWSEGGYSWSPDDRTIAFNSLRRDPPTLGESDIYTMPSTGGAMRLLKSDQTSNNLLGYASGGALWWLKGGVMDPAEYPALVTSAADGSNLRQVVAKNTNAWGDAMLTDTKEGGGFCGPWFDPHDRFLVIGLSGPGFANVARLDTATGALTDISGSMGEAYACAASADGTRVAYAFSDFTHPAEVYISDTQNPAPQRLTTLNDPVMAGLAVSAPQAFTIKDDAGYDVRAWFMPAIGGRGPKHATLLDIHGGPETEFGNSFFHELQYYAGLGYNVVFADPRGSVGFGYPFEEALAKHWGDAMFDDLQRVMDEVVKRPDVDPDRLGVMGGSYGGYSTLWVVGHTDRYKVAVAERVVSNLATEQLAADLASSNALGGAYSWGLPWDPSSQYLPQSPIAYVAQAHTPLLILHSTEDTRTPIDQTLQWFSATKWLGGRTIRFVEFPGETHDLSRTGAPLHRVERLHILSDWVGRYLKP